MIIEAATVIRVADDSVWVSCDNQAGCQRCAEGRGCGGGVFSRLLGDRLREVRVDRYGHRLRAGDHVQIGIAEVDLLKASLMMYLVPLLTMLIMAVIVTRVTPAGWQELGGVLGALAGLFAGLALARRFGQQQGTAGFGPRVIALLPATRAAQGRYPDGKQNPAADNG
jgi:sigma-E factor negative regulatory protein RseC